MIRVYDADNEAEIGSITEEHLGVLQENLVEEMLDEYSFNIDAAAIGSLETNGADGQLIAMLKRALGNRTSMEIRMELD